jgi:DNA-binding response OmpR family regulator
MLDWGLPGMSGLMAVKELRAKGVRTPVLFLTSRDSEKDVVAALSAGADDYLVKPFRAGELAARVRNLLRRVGLSAAANGLAIEEDAPNATSFGVVINRSNSSIQMPNQEPVALTQREFELANYFFERLNQPLARDDIMHAVWRHADTAASRTLDTHISKIRVKLNLRPELGWRLTPVYSYGYRLDYQESA